MLNVKSYIFTEKRAQEESLFASFGLFWALPLQPVLVLYFT